MICSRVPGRLMYQPNCLLLAQVESAAQQTVALLAMSRFCVEVLMVTARSEEHTSELQSRLHLVCRLLLEKKKKTHVRHTLADTTDVQVPLAPDSVFSLPRSPRLPTADCLLRLTVRLSAPPPRLRTRTPAL